MQHLERAAKAIRKEKLSGWLFYNIQNRDTISNYILQIPDNNLNTRPWVYIIYSHKEAIKIVHKIEQTSLDHLRGKKEVYKDRRTFINILQKYALPHNKIACQYSINNPQLSFLDHGTAMLLADLGYNLYSSENLIQRFLSTLSPLQLASHEQTSKKLHTIIFEVWKRVEKAFSLSKPLLYEGDILSWIQNLMTDLGLITDSPLIVATGKNSTGPHYIPKNQGSLLKRGEVLQLDIWAKNNKRGAIYADISWVGVLSPKPLPLVEKVFDSIIKARDSAVNYIAHALEKEKELTGAKIDAYVESILKESGFSKYIKHRTGHAIDQEVHGFGVNLDAKEFPDTRSLIDGSCFSIEPGLYLPEFGLRTEIDVYISKSKVVISGASPQKEMLHL